MAAKRKIVKIHEDKCDGCGLCVPACHEGAIEIVDGKARLIEDKLCDGLGDCLGECPRGAIEVIEREAVEFDEQAVKERLKQLKGNKQTDQNLEDKDEKPVSSGCPGSRMMHMNKSNNKQTNTSRTSTDKSNESEPLDEIDSELSQWPVQLHLLSPGAPFFQDSDLLIAADCVPFAYPEFHRKMLKDKAVAIGCPKLDDAESYIEKLAQIFSVNDIKSVTIAIMEVPCCSGLLSVVNKALELSEADIPVNKVVVGVKGELKE